MDTDDAVEAPRSWNTAVCYYLTPSSTSDIKLVQVVITRLRDVNSSENIHDAIDDQGIVPISGSRLLARASS